MPKEITARVSERTRDVIHSIIMNYSKEIANNIQERKKQNIGKITNVNIERISKHVGAGGKTFIIEGEFQTTVLGRIPGGIVIKFAKGNIETEIANAKALDKLLKKRQKEWRDENRSLPEKLKWIPETLFAPQIIATYESSNCIILEFLEECTPLIKSEKSELEKFMVLGYALGRLHGTKRLSVKMELYEPMFKILLPYVGQQAIDFWRWIIENSKGGVPYIHGDSHLENVLRVGSDALAWIDAQLIPKSERFDDLAYAISHAMQEEIAENINQKHITLKDFAESMVKRYVQQIIPVTISAYKQTCNLKGIYSHELPVDFFLGAHLIIRSELWEEEVKNALIYMGKYFINQRPVNYMLKSKSKNE